MKNLYYILSAVLMFTFSGCSTTEVQYIPPKHTDSIPLKHSTVVKKDFDSSWNGLLSNISSNQFTLNSSDKKSGLINISYSATDLSQHADCGEFIGAFSTITGRQKYNINGTSAVSFSEHKGSNTISTERTATLSDSANITVLNIDTNATKIGVNVMYVLHIVDQITTSNPHYEGKVQTIAWDLPFSTNSLSEESGKKVQCVSTGYLEQKILDYAK